MKSVLEINGKSLAPIKAAAAATSYSRDYITRLAREEKIVASYINRQWFVDIDSLQRYAENTALEQAVRQRILSQERKQEQMLRTQIERRQTAAGLRARSIPVRSAVASLLIVGAGFTAGSFIHNQISVPTFAHTFSFFSQPITTSSFTPAANHMPAQTGSAMITNTTLAEQAPRVAVATTKSLGAAKEGVLLLPDTEMLPAVSELFSDTVTVRKSADGSHTVVLINEEGTEVGNPVPFVVVPVNESGL